MSSSGMSMVSLVICDVRLSASCKHDVVRSYMSQVCAGGALTKSRQQQCVRLSSNIVSTMTATDIDLTSVPANSPPTTSTRLRQC